MRYNLSLKLIKLLSNPPFSRPVTPISAAGKRKDALPSREQFHRSYSYFLHYFKNQTIILIRIQGLRHYWLGSTAANSSANFVETFCYLSTKSSSIARPHPQAAPLSFFIPLPPSSSSSAHRGAADSLSFADCAWEGGLAKGIIVAAGGGRVRCPLTHFPNPDVVFANYTECQDYNYRVQIKLRDGALCRSNLTNTLD